jgi:hypothetical protein
MRRAAVCFAVLSVSCGPPLMKLPSGPGTPAGDAAAAVMEAMTACRAVSTLTAEMAVSGSVAGRRIRGRLLAGVAAPNSARLEAVAPAGQPLFIFVARANDATLLLPRDGRVLEHGPPGTVLEAVAAAPLDPSDLRRALTGCADAPDVRSARQVGPDWRVVPDGPGEIYLRREGRTSPWRIVGAVHRVAARIGEPAASAWRAEYHDFQDGLPRTVRLTAVDSKRFDLQLRLSQVELNVPINDEAFTIRIPPNTEPITLQELKDAGPLGTGGAGKAETGSRQ